MKINKFIPSELPTLASSPVILWKLFGKTIVPGLVYCFIKHTIAYKL